MVQAVDVVIPILEYDPNTYWIVQKFQRHPGISRVFLAIDPDISTVGQNTIWIMKREFNKVVIIPGARGKGQNVMRAVWAVQTARVLFCDCDYIGLSYDHITLMTKSENGMVIGVPMYPYDRAGVPAHVLNAWPLVSGFRALPRDIVPGNLHGYLMETQLNQAAHKAGLIVEKVYMSGLVSPFSWPLPPWRHEQMVQDRAWGLANGVFG